MTFQTKWVFCLFVSKQFCHKQCWLCVSVKPNKQLINIVGLDTNWNKSPSRLNLTSNICIVLKHCNYPKKITFQTLEDDTVSRRGNFLQLLHKRKLLETLLSRSLLSTLWHTPTHDNSMSVISNYQVSKPELFWLTNVNPGKSWIEDNVMTVHTGKLSDTSLSEAY